MTERSQPNSANLPWEYRPRDFDDWGWIRDTNGKLAACARGDTGTKTHNQHRTDNTDPYGEYAALIVKAVNNHAEMVRILKAIDKSWLETFDRGPDGDYGGVALAEEHKTFWRDVRAVLSSMGEIEL